jgi:hypothetical protein
VLCVRHSDPWYDVINKMRVAADTAEVALKAAGAN